MPVEIAPRSEIGIPAKAGLLGRSAQSDAKEFSIRESKATTITSGAKPCMPCSPCPCNPCSPCKPCR